MTSPRTAQADSFPEVHTPRFYYYNGATHLWEVVVPLTDGDNPQLEWIGFYDTYDAGAAAVSNYLTASREIGDRLGVPVPIWQNMILALRARASSLESLLWDSREQLLYQVQGSNHLHNENERLKSVIELLKNRLIDYGEGAYTPPMTPSPPPIKMTRDITSMVDGDIQSPPALQRVHSFSNALDGFDT